MDKERENKNFSHLDDRLKINTSFEEAIRILVQEQPKDNKDKDNKKSQKNR